MDRRGTPYLQIQQVNYMNESKETKIYSATYPESEQTRVTLGKLGRSFIIIDQLPQRPIQTSVEQPLNHLPRAATTIAKDPILPRNPNVSKYTWPFDNQQIFHNTRNMFHNGK